MNSSQDKIRTPLDAGFDIAARKLLDEWHVPGMTVAVIDGEHTLLKGYGIASYPDEKVTPETLFFTASTTKAFTSAVVQMLIEDEAAASSNSQIPTTSTTKAELLTWQTIVSSILPDDFVVSDPNVTNHATLEDLACHHTGMPDHENAFPPKMTDGTDVKAMARMLRHLPMDPTARGKFIYNDMMYTTLSHIIETRTGVNLGIFVKKKIWDPLGMKSTYWTVPDALAAEKRGIVKLARGYAWDEATASYLLEDLPDFPAVSGAGATISNVLDYTKWLRCMLSLSPPLSPAAHNTLTTPRIDVIKSNSPFEGMTRYALGWFVDEYRGEKIVWHTGGWTGFGALMCFVPGREWGVCMVGNTAKTSNMVQICLWFRLLDQLLGTPEGERGDWNGKYKELIRSRREANLGARERLYPGLKGEGEEEVDLKRYEGRYRDEGYGELVFVLGKRGLVADRQEMEIAMDIRLEHVSGEAWLAYLEVKNRDKRDVQVVRAEFVVIDGRVERCGIELESALEGVKIWFVRCD